MVRVVSIQAAEEDNPRADKPDPVAEGEDVLVHRVEGHEDSLQALRVALLLHGDRQRRQRTADHRGDPPVRGAVGQVFRVGLRAGHHIQLREGVLHTRRAADRWRGARHQQKVNTEVDHRARHLARGLIANLIANFCLTKLELRTLL